MYGIIGSSVILGILMVQYIKRKHMKSFQGHEILFPPKDRSYPRYIIGGIIFGMGWALAGVCPGPMFILIGEGHTVLIVFLAAAMTGTVLYGVLRTKLPH